MEPWLFVPGNYNGRIGVIWETCTACKMCVTACPNDCLYMTTELRADVLDGADGEHGGIGADLEVGKFAAVEVPEVAADLDDFNHVTAHTAPPEEWRFAEVLDLSVLLPPFVGTIRVKKLPSFQHPNSSGRRPNRLRPYRPRAMHVLWLVHGSLWLQCSFFMTNEYDGMSGFTRQHPVV